MLHSYDEQFCEGNSSGTFQFCESMCKRCCIYLEFFVFRSLYKMFFFSFFIPTDFCLLFSNINSNLKWTFQNNITDTTKKTRITGKSTCRLENRCLNTSIYCSIELFPLVRVYLNLLHGFCDVLWPKHMEIHKSKAHWMKSNKLDMIALLNVLSV